MSKKISTTAKGLILSVAKSPAGKEAKEGPTEPKPAVTKDSREAEAQLEEKEDEKKSEVKSEKPKDVADGGVRSLTDSSDSEFDYFPKRKKQADLIQGECPFEKLALETSNAEARKTCPFKAFHSHKDLAEATIKKAPALGRYRGNYAKSAGSAKLLKDIGGGDRIREACTRFYARAFKDKLISQFMTIYTDGASYHGKRLGDWIVQQMGGEGDPWSDSGRHNMRSLTHFQAWNAKSRDKKVRGERFKLDDCRVWMRLHFWAFREVGLAKHKAFWKWYVSFIGHFIRVYERKAPPFAAESAAWSAKKANVEKYIKDWNYSMKDVNGFGRYSWSTPAYPKDLSE